LDETTLMTEEPGQNPQFDAQNSAVINVFRKQARQIFYSVFSSTNFK